MLSGADIDCHKTRKNACFRANSMSKFSQLGPESGNSTWGNGSWGLPEKIGGFAQMAKKPGKWVVLDLTL